jgi:hypothetical protein
MDWAREGEGERQGGHLINYTDNVTSVYMLNTQLQPIVLKAHIDLISKGWITGAVPKLANKY